jgi:hypothetical protein
MVASAIGTVWPADQPEWRPIVATLYLVTTSVMSVMVSKRWLSWSAIKSAPFVKLMVLTTLGASFLFLFASAILVLGVGTSVSQIACEVGIWWCILLYATSKVLI